MLDPKLKQDASMALAWGTPCHESIGYSSSEFSSIIRRQQRYIEELEKALYGIECPREISKIENMRKLARGENIKDI